MSQSEYTVNINVIARDQTSAAATKASKSLLTLANAAKVVALGYAALRAAQKGLEFLELGATVEAAEHRLTAFAGSADQAAAYLKALQIGTDYTIDSLTAMAQASRMLETDMVTNTREMELAGAMVAKLGNQARSTESRMQMLTLLLANQSVMRLDEFGLSIERVRARQQALEKQGLSTEAAFRGAVFAEAEQKLAKLGDTADLAATKLDKLKAAATDAKTELAAMATQAVLAGQDVDQLTRIIRTIPEAIAAPLQMISALGQFMQGNIAEAAKQADALLNMAEVAINTMEGMQQIEGVGWVDPQAAQGWRDRAAALNEYARAAGAIVDATAAIEKQTYTYTTAMVENLSTLGGAGQEIASFISRTLEANSATDGFTAAVDVSSYTLAAQAQAAMQSSFALMDLASSYAMFQQQAAYAYSDYAGSMEDIEAQYQKTIGGITSGGGGGGGGGGAEREFDRADIERGLKIQRLQLEEFEKQREDFDKASETDPVFWYELDRQDRKWLMESGKTLEDLALKRGEEAKTATELERAQMDDRIEDLKKEIGETARILEQGHWDRHEMRVAAAQRDTAALMEEAKKRRDDQIAALEKSQGREEQARSQSLGRIKLAAFDNWVSMNIDTENMTLEQQDMIAGMRQGIMIEYGLLTQEALDEIDKMTKGFEDMWKTAQLGAQETMTELDKVIAKLEAMPDEKVISIRYELANKPEDIPERQHGGPVSAGSPYLVGEKGPELFVPGSSGQVINNRRTEQMIGSNNTYNINDTRAMAFLAANERAQARAAFAEASGM